MSNFAERLVARSAGAAPAPVSRTLAPRPASRFEPTAGIELDVVADAEPRHRGRPLLGQSRNPVRPSHIP